MIDPAPFFIVLAAFSALFIAGLCLFMWWGER